MGDMRSVRTFGVAAGVLAVASGCVPPSEPPPVADYSCLSIPSDLERPGVVISRKANGEQPLLVVDLLRNQAGQRETANVVFTETAIESVNTTRRGVAAANASLNVLEALLKTVAPGSSINASAEAKRNWSGNISYQNLSRERTFQEPIQTRALTWARSQNLDPDLRYYLIRDTLVAGATTIEMDRTFTANAQLTAAVELAGKASAVSSLDTGASYRLSSRLEPPKTVCVILYEIERTATAAAPGGSPAPSLVALSPRPTVINDLQPIRR